MALDIRIYSASYLADLDAGTVYVVREGQGSLGWPETQRLFATSWARGYHPLASVRYGNRQAQLTVRLTDTSLDNWITSYRNLEQMLLLTQHYWASGGVEGEKAALVVQLNGMTNAVEYDILAGELPAGELFGYPMRVTAAPMYAEIPMALTLKPFGRPQALVEVTSASIANGRGTADAAGSYSLAAPAGDVEAPLRLVLQLPAAQNASQFLLARRTRGNVANFIFGLHAETTAESGYAVTKVVGGGDTLTDTAVAAAESGQVNRLVSAAGADFSVSTYVQWNINENLGDWYGEYLVGLRIDAQSTTGDAAVSYQLKHGGDGTSIANVAVTVAASNTDFVVWLGRLRIPTRDGPLDAALTSFLFRVYFARPSGNTGVQTVDLDCIYLIPIDEFFMDQRVTGGVGNQDQLLIDTLAPTAVTAVLDSAGDLQPDLVTPPNAPLVAAVAGRVNLWLPLLFTGTPSSTVSQGHDLADTLTLNFRYHPLYALLR